MCGCGRVCVWVGVVVVNGEVPECVCVRVRAWDRWVEKFLAADADPDFTVVRTRQDADVVELQQTT